MNNKYHLIFENSLEAIFLLGPRGAILDANSAACRLFGYVDPVTMKEQNGKIFNEDDSPVKRILSEMDNEEKFKGELDFKKKDGSRFTAEVKIIKNNQGELKNQELIVFLREITEKKHIEKELWSSEAKFSMTFHSNPVACAIARLRDGQYMDVNDSFLEMTGYNLDEIIGYSVYKKDLWISGDQKNRYIQCLKERGVVHNFEFEFIRKSGISGYGLISAALIIISGEPCVLSQVVDITERKHIEKAVLDSEEKYRILADNIPGLAFHVDNSLRYVFVNSNFASFHNRNREEILGKSVKEFLSESLYRKTKPYMDKVLSGEDVYFEIGLEFPNSKPEWHRVYYVPHFSKDGIVLGYFGLIINIETQKNIEISSL